MVLFFKIKNKTLQYIISIVSILTTSFICYFISDIVGYRTIALVLLFVVSILAILFDIYPVLTAALLSAVIWDFFFIPPHFTLHVDNTEDALMLMMYFIIALVNGVLTTRIRRIEQISQLKEEKLNSIKLYNTLFNSVSHELKTPISTIYGSTDHLLNYGEILNEETKNKLIKEIHSATERLNKLIGNLLNISRLEAGYMTIKKDWCNINELIYTIIDSFMQTGMQQKISVDIDEEFPLIKIDYGLIEQVLTNIIHNASVYTPTETEITIKVKLENHIMEIAVSDSGPGIADDEIGKIFDKFYSGKGNSVKGTGLGLSIAKGFVEAHNGKIKAFKNDLKGLTIHIAIPLKNDEELNLNTIKNE